MAVPSEVRRVQAAIDNNNRKELEWSLWYARMRQSVASARPADVKYWNAVERQVDEILTPPPPSKVYPTRKKKENRGLGLSPLPGEEPVSEASMTPIDLVDPNFRAPTAGKHREVLATISRPMQRKKPESLKK